MSWAIPISGARSTPPQTFKNGGWSLRETSVKPVQPRLWIGKYPPIRPYYHCCHDDDTRLISFQPLTDFVIFEEKDESAVDIPNNPAPSSPSVYAWVQTINLPDIPLDKSIDADAWKTIVDEVQGTEQLPLLLRIALDLAAHKTVALCVRIHTLQLELRTLTQRIKECQGATGHEIQAACSRLIRALQAKQQLLKEAKAAKSNAEAELKEAKAEAARFLANPANGNAPTIGELTPQ